MTSERDQARHPLDDCDPDQCYQTMMAERTALITARRESEDNLVRTIIQLSAALIALLAGFLSQSNVRISGIALAFLGSALLLVGLAIIAGLTEHYFSSKAYEEQQRLVEQFYQKLIYNFGPAPSNRWVRAAQVLAFIFFVLGLVSLGLFAFDQAGDRHVQRQRILAAIPSNASATPKPANGSGKAGPRQIGSAVDAASPAAEKVSKAVTE